MRAVRLVLIFIVCGLLIVGCGGSRGDQLPSAQGDSRATRTSDQSEVPTLTGTMEDWLAAVCHMGYYEAVILKYRLPRADPNGLSCITRDFGSYGIFIGSYMSIDDLKTDLASHTPTFPIGPHAVGYSPVGEFVMFAMEETISPVEALYPLKQFGFDVSSATRAATPLPRQRPSEQPQAVPVPTAVEPTSVTPSHRPNIGTTHLRLRSENGNIACEFWEEGGRGEATCEVRQHVYQPPVMTGCRDDWPNKFRLREGEAVATYCYDGSIFNDVMPVQAEGQPISIGSITCVFEQTNGVTCKDGSTGHFFQASRQAYRWQ